MQEVRVKVLSTPQIVAFPNGGMVIAVVVKRLEEMECGLEPMFLAGRDIPDLGREVTAKIVPDFFGLGLPRLTYR